MGIRRKRKEAKEKEEFFPYLYELTSTLRKYEYEEEIYTRRVYISDEVRKYLRRVERYKQRYKYKYKYNNI